MPVRPHDDSSVLGSLPPAGVESLRVPIPLGPHPSRAAPTPTSLGCLPAAGPHPERTMHTADRWSRLRAGGAAFAQVRSHFERGGPVGLEPTSSGLKGRSYP